MAKKKVLKCQTCANQVDGTYCTLSFYRDDLSMNEKSRVYKKCSGYKTYVAPPPKPEIKKVEKKLDYESMGDFGKFLKNGGHHSFRTGETKLT